MAAENQSFWTDSGLDPKGIRAGLLQQRLGRGHPGRLHDHPAVRQGPLPDPGALLRAQGQGGHPVAEAAPPAVQDRDPAGLPQHHLLRPRRVRRAGGRPGVLRQGRRRPEPAPVGRAGQRAQQPLALRPRRRQGRQAGARGTLRLRARADGRSSRASRPRRPRRPPSGCRSSPRSRPRARTAARRATCSTMVRDELNRARLQRRRDRRRRPAGDHDLHRGRDERRRGGRARGAPRGLRRQAAARRRGQRRARHRRGARLLRRPGLRAVAVSTGPSPAARPARP